MQESVIATFNDVQFIQGVTPMTQANWQEYFGTTLKSGIYSGFGQGVKRDGTIIPHVIYDGVAIANGIRAEIETELGYTDIGFLDAYGDVLDRFICLRIHFLSETAELIKKESIAEKAYTSEQTNEMLMRTMLQFEYDESYMCTRNNQYYDIPLFYQAKYGTWLFLGRDLRRIINSDPIYTLNPIKNDFHKAAQSEYKLVSGANYYSADLDPTYIFPDTVDVTKMAVLTIETQSKTREIRLSKIPYLNNFISPQRSTCPVPESLSAGYKVNYIFSTESWTETDAYYSYIVPAFTKKVFRLSFRGAQYSHTEGYADYDYDFNFFVEEIYNYQSTQWGAISGNITDQIDLSTKLDELSQSTTDISETLHLKAPIASPAFTGTPTAPTPASGDNSTKLATTEFVNDAISVYMNSDETLYVRLGDSGDGSQANPFGRISTAVSAAKPGKITKIIVIGDFIQSDLIVIPQGKTIVLSNSRNGFLIRLTGGQYSSDPTITIDGGALYLDNATYDIRGEITQHPILVKNGGLLYFNAKHHDSSVDIDNKARLSVNCFSGGFYGSIHVTSMSRVFLGHNNDTPADITFYSGVNGIYCDTGGYAVVANKITCEGISGCAFTVDGGVIIHNGVVLDSSGGVSNVYRAGLIEGPKRDKYYVWTVGGATKGDGTQSNPFTSINNALSAIKDSTPTTIYLDWGTYNEDVTILDYMNVTFATFAPAGESEIEKRKIAGKLVVKGKLILEHIELKIVTTGSNTGLSIESGGQVIGEHLQGGSTIIVNSGRTCISVADGGKLAYGNDLELSGMYGVITEGGFVTIGHTVDATNITDTVFSSDHGLIIYKTVTGITNQTLHHVAEGGIISTGNGIVINGNL